MASKNAVLSQLLKPKQPPPPGPMAQLMEPAWPSVSISPSSQTRYRIRSAATLSRIIGRSIRRCRRLRPLGAVRGSNHGYRASMNSCSGMTVMVELSISSPMQDTKLRSVS